MDEVAANWLLDTFGSVDPSTILSLEMLLHSVYNDGWNDGHAYED